jgi:hypothetical protein
LVCRPAYPPRHLPDLRAQRRELEQAPGGDPVAFVREFDRQVEDDARTGPRGQDDEAVADVDALVDVVGSCPPGTVRPMSRRTGWSP